MMRSLVIGVFCGALTAVTGGAPSARALLLLDSAHMDSVRTRIAAGDAELNAALAALEEDAKKALVLKPVSVMDKTVTPPSGDKHDYMSQAPYWWPDPGKPTGRPYIRKDGVRNPEINGISDHDNLGRLTSAVSTLGLAFRLSGREEYAAHAARLVRVWFLDGATRMNPHLRFGQGIPGTNDGRGIGIIETRGLPEMLDGIHLIDGSTAWTPADDKGLRDWMRDYARWLVESQYGKDEGSNGNNHETWYDVQVAALALYTGQDDLAKRTIERSRERIVRHFEPDGRQPRELERTRSWDYSAFNLTAFFHLAALGERVGVDLWQYRTADGRSLRAGLDYMVPVAAGGRKWTHDQITDFRPGAIHWLLRRAAVVWKNPAYRDLATRIGGGSPRIDLTVP
jgi:Alginate lyase